MNIGIEWIVDAGGCPAGVLRDIGRMQAVCDRIVAELALCMMGRPQWHTFDGQGGVTGLYLLSESHLSCHTWPEFGTAAFNLFTCRPRRSWDWRRSLTELLDATEVAVRRIARGGAGSTTTGETPPDHDAVALTAVTTAATRVGVASSFDTDDPAQPTHQGDSP